jgi:hypothetical protein
MMPEVWTYAGFLHDAVVVVREAARRVSPPRPAAARVPAPARDPVPAPVDVTPAEPAVVA